MAITGRTSKALCLCGFALLLAGLGPTRAEAQRFDPHFPFGSTDINGTAMIGLVPGQTARFNAVNIGAPANTCQAYGSFTRRGVATPTGCKGVRDPSGAPINRTLTQHHFP